MCFERSSTEAIPGCDGAGDLGTDYCFERPENYLWIMGDNGKPKANFPLGNCEGDCDKKSDCMEGLECFQRGGLEDVPGCEGLGQNGKDYCYDPTSSYIPSSTVARSYSTSLSSQEGSSDVLRKRRREPTHDILETAV